MYAGTAACYFVAEFWPRGSLASISEASSAHNRRAMSTPSTLDARLAKAEAAIVALTRELAAIRAQLACSTPDAAGEKTRAARDPKAQSALDFERLLGRYGMLGIAVLAAIAAVGTFLSWAISRGYLTLGPTARVLIGLVFAAGIGAWGFKLRRRERSFGSSLVGLALVIVLVCAYAAGPGFNLVPTWLAFVVVSVISWTLAIFARGQDDEPLWCVAFGGASIAPFATNGDSGHLYALLAYALITLLAACFAISHRQWPVAWKVFYAGAALFVGSSALLANSHGSVGVAATFALPLVVGAIGILPFAPNTRKRAALRWLAILALLVTAAPNPSWFSTHAWLLAVEMLVATALWLFIVDRLCNPGGGEAALIESNARRAPTLDWADAAVIPLLLALRAAALSPASLPTVAIYAIVAVMVLAATWRHSVGSLRDGSAFAVVALTVGVLTEVSPADPLSRVIGFLVIATVAIALHTKRPSLSWVLTAAGLFVLAATFSLDSLIERTIYQTPPFVTPASFAALMVTIALAIVARSWRWLFEATRAAMGRRARRSYADRVRAMLKAAIAAPWAWAFVWMLVELAMAYSASTSTLLLVTYFAATAVASVAVGRVRRSARLRRIGLGLALAAAATSVYGASTYFDIGNRILAYLVTSAFLLGIAYWYRRPGLAASA
jgi:Predicted membrane protein (DUF2339)